MLHTHAWEWGVAFPLVPGVFLTVGLIAHGYDFAITLRGEACHGPLRCRGHSEERERLGGCESSKEGRTRNSYTSFGHFCMSHMNKPLQIQQLTLASMDIPPGRGDGEVLWLWGYNKNKDAHRGFIYILEKKKKILFKHLWKKPTHFHNWILIVFNFSNVNSCVNDHAPPPRDNRLQQNRWCQNKKLIADLLRCHHLEV